MSKPHRCHECKHRPGPRVLVYTKATEKKNPLAVPRQHKKPCHCECHDPALDLGGAA